MTIRFLPAGDTALVVEFGNRIDRDLSDAVLQLSGALGEAKVPGIIETVPTFRSLLIYYDPLVTSAADLRREIEGRAAQGSAQTRKRLLWRIPACYDATCAPDLAEVAERTGLGTAEVIKLHAGTQFHVYMVGFLPGYAYMGDLPKALQLPRRESPRARVPAGSIAIATDQTGIYPVESPGGWHLIGKTPVRLFDAGRAQPSLFAQGDAVRFEPVSVAELDDISRDVAAGKYNVPCDEVAS